MADIQYINYGDQQIDQQELNNLLKDESKVRAYVNSQPWSNKRKQLFMENYYDMLGRGITGFSIQLNPETNRNEWYTNLKDDNIDYGNRKRREMYGEVSYYMRQLASKLPTRASQEEEAKKKKEDLPVFDNKYFTSGLQSYIGNKMFGQRDWSTSKDWNVLDERDSKGIRGTNKRAEKLAEMLEGYLKTVDKDKVNFEGGAFTDYDDFSARINTAIGELRNGTWNQADKDSLNRIGINPDNWFNNGSGDPYKTEGYEGTYGDYYGRFLPQQEKDKAKVEAEKQKAQQANYWSGYKYYNLSKYNGRPLTSEESNLEHLNKIISKDKWSGDEASQIVQAFKLAERNGQLVSITDKNELAKFGPMWKNRVRQLRKINGIEGIYYDTVGKKFIKPYKNGQTPQTSFQDILDQNNPETIAKKKADSDQKLREQYAKRTEMTPQDWEYVASVIPDIASIPDEEPFSAATLAFAGAGMRHHALANRPGGMSTSDKWWQVADYLGAGLASIPGFGDAYLVGRILNTTRKFATGLFAAAGAYGLGSATVNAFGKWAKGEDMTLQEKMDVVMAIPSLVSAYRLRSREGLNDAAKAANQNNITTNKGKVKVTVTDESGNKSVKEITGLSEQKSKELQKQFKNAGNDNSKKTQILKSDSEVQAKASEQGIDLNKVSIETDSRHMASYRKPTEIEFYPETSPSSARTRYNQEIENLKNSGHNWQARRLQIYDKFYKGTGGARKESDGNWFKKAWHYVTDTPNQEFANKIKNGETPKTNSTEVPKTTETKSNWSREKINKYQKNLEQMESSFLDRSKYNSNSKSQKKIDLSKDISSEKYSLADGEQLELSMSNGILNVKGPNGIKVSQRVHDQLEIKKVVSDIIKNYNNSIGRSSATVKRFSKEYIESLKELRRKGYLFKQGGTIDKQKIQKYKEFIKK